MDASPTRIAGAACRHPLIMFWVYQIEAQPAVQSHSPLTHSLKHTAVKITHFWLASDGTWRWAWYALGVWTTKRGGLPVFVFVPVLVIREEGDCRGSCIVLSVRDQGPSRSAPKELSRRNAANWIQINPFFALLGFVNLLFKPNGNHLTPEGFYLFIYWGGGGWFSVEKNI